MIPVSAADPFALIRPFLLRLEPECAHQMTVKALESGLAGMLAAAPPADPRLAVRAFGRWFSNPVGMAAGFDKNGQVIAPLLRLGFGFVEVGTVTPRAQPGNPRPRVFRWPERQAMINRFGFNNSGAAALAARLTAFRAAPHRPPGVVGVNLGRNKDSPDEVADYVDGVRRFAALADYLVINISSPNTPGLRALQERPALTRLLTAVLAARDEVLPGPQRPPVLVKIAPDLSDEALADVVDVVLATRGCGSSPDSSSAGCPDCGPGEMGGIGGMIVSNTTVARPADLPAALAGEAGGLSGPPLFARSTAMLADVFRATGGRIPLIGVGGIASAADAWAKVAAGASLVQLYTALVYQGPRLVRDIQRGLAARLEADGFRSLGEAIGSGV